MVAGLTGVPGQIAAVRAAHAQGQRLALAPATSLHLNMGVPIVCKVPTLLWMTVDLSGKKQAHPVVLAQSVS